MPEKLSPFQRPEPRIVGPASSERKEQFRQSILEKFGEHHYQQFPHEGKSLKAAEYEKRPAEIQFIAKANAFTNRFLSDADLTPFDIPEQNIHIVPREAFKEVGDPDDVGCTFADKQSFFINAERARTNLLTEARVILHEMIHMKEHLVFQLDEKRMSDIGKVSWSVARLKKTKKRVTATRLSLV